MKAYGVGLALMAAMAVLGCSSTGGAQRGGAEPTGVPATPPPPVSEPTRMPATSPLQVSEPSDTTLPKLGEYVAIDELPEAISKVPPSYPEVGHDIEGTVLVQALVGTDGRIKDTMVVKSVPMLDEAAVTAVRQWVFKPAMAKGKPVAVWVAVPVRFGPH